MAKKMKALLKPYWVTTRCVMERGYAVEAYTEAQARQQVETWELKPDTENWEDEEVLKVGDNS